MRSVKVAPTQKNGVLGPKGLPGSPRDAWDVTDDKDLEELTCPYAALQEATDYAIFSEDAGGIITWGTGAERLTGYSSEEAVGRPVSFLSHPDHWEELSRLRGRLWDGTPLHSFPTTWLRKDRSQTDVRLTTVPLKDRAGRIRGASTIAQDVKPVSRCEEEHGWQKAALAATANAVLVTDRQGQIQWVNPAFTNLTGYPPAEVIGQNPRLLKSGRQDPAIYRNLWQTILAGKVWHGELINRRKDGSLYTAQTTITPVTDKHGVITHFVAGAARVTNGNLMEEALHLSEQWNRTLVETARDAIFSVSPGGLLTSLSPAFETITGWPRSEWLGKPFAPLVHPADLPRIMDLFRRALQGETLPLFETRVLTKAGKCATVEITTTPQIHQGKVVAVLGIARDITERKQLEAQYRQAQKMEAVGRLAGGVTHDFNNLLTIITGYSELLLGSQDVPASAHGLIREIQRSGERAAALTRQLLAFSRKQVLTPTVLDLNVVVTGLEKMLHRLIGEDINLTIRLDPALVRIKADPGQLEQVIMNLVVNARDAMPSGGNLTIETRNAELTEAQARARPGLGKGLHALLVVADTGCGMDEETRAHLFEPFFTTKGPGKGTGLGLATVFGIVQQSSGHIEVESQVARGSTFLIYLPGVEEACPSPRSEPSLLPIRGGTQTVLLAEDDDGVRLLARLALQSHGYTVLEARNGQEALTLCHEHQGSVHLLITDVVMPLMSGRELADRLKSRRPDIRVLYLSGYTGDTVLHHGVLETGLAFLQKPFTPAALARKVRDLLDQPESARR